MNMSARNQYLKELQKRYFQTRSKKEKSSMLDEYCRNTSQNRKYVTSKINSHLSSKPKKRRKRKKVYDGYAKEALAKAWEIFDCPCGQRLIFAPKNRNSSIKTARGSLHVQVRYEKKLERISPRTIDESA